MGEVGREEEGKGEMLMAQSERLGAAGRDLFHHHPPPQRGR